jgi:hypothetical protein
MAKIHIARFSPESREERRARTALKRELKASEGNDEAIGLQLFGQAMPAPVYERFRAITNQNLKRRRVRQALPDNKRYAMVVIWGLEAGSEIVPMFSVRDFPNLLGTTVAVRCKADAPYRTGFVTGLTSWFEMNAAASHPWSLAPPILQQWQLDGVKTIETIDFGLRYPLPALDVVAA